LSKRTIIDANTFFGFYPKRKVNSSLEALIQIMEKNGVSRALTLSLKGVFYNYEEGNEETLRMCKNHGNLMPVAILDPRRFLGERSEIENLLDLGFKAFRLFPDVQGYPLNYSPVIEIFNCLDGLKAPLLISVGGRGDITAISKLTYGKDIPIIIVGCFYSNLSEFIISARKNKNLYVETHHLASPDSLEVLVNKVGADRIIFGSGTPLEYFQASYMMVESSRLSEEHKNLVLGENLLRIIGEEM